MRFLGIGRMWASALEITPSLTRVAATCPFRAAGADSSHPSPWPNLRSWEKPTRGAGRGGAEGQLAEDIRHPEK